MCLTGSMTRYAIRALVGSNVERFEPNGKKTGPVALSIDTARLFILQGHSVHTMIPDAVEISFLDGIDLACGRYRSKNLGIVSFDLEKRPVMCQLQHNCLIARPGHL